MGMSMELRMSVRQEKLPRLQLEQTILSTTVIPEGICPDCGYGLTEDEIRKGWSASLTDFTTACPECRTRFIARLRTEDEDTGDIGYWDYLCRDQLLHALVSLRKRKGRKNLGVLFLAKQARGLLWNIVRHFGAYEVGLAALRRWEATH